MFQFVSCSAKVAFVRNKCVFIISSSIAPYEAEDEPKDETTLSPPNTPHGIHELVENDATRKLTIIGPGAVHGKSEDGNITRLYWTQRKYYFFYLGS
jgi:hypothetical protein